MLWLSRNCCLSFIRARKEILNVTTPSSWVSSLLALEHGKTTGSGSELPRVDLTFFGTQPAESLDVTSLNKSLRKGVEVELRF